MATVFTNQTEFLVVFDDVRSDLVSGTVKLCIVLTSSALVHVIGVFGIASNVVNIAVFATQGFSDSINISLVSLAVSDLLSIAAAQWLMVCLNPWFQANLQLAFFAPETQTLTGGYPHVFFSRVSAWITAFVSLERSVAVTQPFRVRRIFTRRVTTIFNLAVFPVVWAGAAPLYSTTRLGQKFYPPPVNSTLIGLVFLSSHSQVMTATSPVTEILGPLTCFTTVILCNAVIRLKVSKMAKWRSKVTGRGAITSNSSIGTEESSYPKEKPSAVEKSFKAKGKDDSVQAFKESRSIPKGGIIGRGKKGYETRQNPSDVSPVTTLPKTTSTVNPGPNQSVLSPSAVTKEAKKARDVAPLSTLNTDASPTVSTSGSLPNKERRLVVMVSGVSAIFIVCYTPLVAQLAARILVPELSSTGRYRALNASMGTVGVLLGCLNASINALVYWRMSSKYRATFNGLVIACKRLT